LVAVRVPRRSDHGPARVRAREETSMRTLVLANHKGGVGKSAVATLLAQYCVRQGHRVLAIDLDHQGNFSEPLIRSKRAQVAATTSDLLLSTDNARVPSGGFVLVPAGDPLLALERQPALHTPFARNLRNFLKSVDDGFDVCLIDTHPNPDIRLIAALATGDFVVSPIQLNQEAIDGVRALLHHPRVGIYKIKGVLNPKLALIGLLPTQVEATPFQRENFAGLVERHLPLLIRLSDRPGDVAFIPRRSAIAVAQAEGSLLWEIKKTAARDAWTEIEPTLRRIVAVVRGEVTSRAV
jgi:chromosome partitioning protein